MKPLTSAFLLLTAFLTLTCCAAAQHRLFDVAKGEEVTLEKAGKRIAAARIVCVGELHDRSSHHLAQLAVIRELHESGTSVTVGLEMFEQRNQDILDAWVAGRIDEQAFLPHFRANWGDMWPLYRDIFLYCRDELIPMVGLNVPRSIVRQVAVAGFDSLTPEQLGELPPASCDVAPDYMELLQQTFGHHGSDQSFVNFCEAQVVWDTAMAYYALEALEQGPQSTMVVLAGTIHAWRKGIPARVERIAPGTSTLVIQPEIEGRLDQNTVTTQDCDYLFLNL